MILLFTLLTIAAIVAQLPHAWYTFESFSRLEGSLKTIQSITFCLIISVAIFAFVMLGKPMLALFGVGIEIIINLYYYSLNYWQRKNARVDMRKQWISFLFGILIPVMIFIFSEQLNNMRNE